MFVRWVRSGIGFSAHQKEMVRSLGLRRLNQTVELQDTPPVRGLVASIPHLVEIVEPRAGSRARIEIPEYTILEAPAATPATLRHIRTRKAKASSEAAPAADSAGDQGSSDAVDSTPEITEGKE
ncbi:MAG: 50S ribosomal protein L30 [Acidobacteriota bacterium]|nr:50S ribosomal protein L30 [Acidobacteriota bacterium]